ncbi:MAG: metalloregulator ArsR/SmtB family transcription factor [Gemmatimonadetes bacterium]|nr:metalloregulator ArsR/SmtB family transcription factor [Gemmatimonadota bacterium]
MSKQPMTGALRDLIASRFRVLAEPARLHILDVLRDGELTVNEIVAHTELGQANVSRHLRQLHDLGFVTRRREGLHVHYAIKDRKIFQLCDLVCGQVDTDLAARRRVVATHFKP